MLPRTPQIYMGRLAPYPHTHAVLSAYLSAYNQACQQEHDHKNMDPDTISYFFEVFGMITCTLHALVILFGKVLHHLALYK